MNASLVPVRVQHEQKRLSHSTYLLSNRHKLRDCCCASTFPSGYSPTLASTDSPDEDPLPICSCSVRLNHGERFLLACLSNVNLESIHDVAKKGESAELEGDNKCKLALLRLDQVRHEGTEFASLVRLKFMKGAYFGNLSLF